MLAIIIALPTSSILIYSLAPKILEKDELGSSIKTQVDEKEL